MIINFPIVKFNIPHSLFPNNCLFIVYLIQGLKRQFHVGRRDGPMCRMIQTHKWCRLSNNNTIFPLFQGVIDTIIEQMIPNLKIENNE